MRISSTRDRNFPTVVVTGLAATTSIAGDADSTWKGLLDGETGIDVLNDDFIDQFELQVRIGGHLKVKPSACLSAAEAVGNHASVYAPKSALGHSIGAVGALESVITVLSVRDGIVPPTLNLDNQDPDIDLDIVRGRSRTGRIDYAVKNSFGFGGHNVALAFGRY
ncbi:beta-ketoacyl synthase N-terminal-like domain-containing protein [Nocardia sp. 2YAB30]|uniref:beta-ketoacyl synthase N-terminal-like domain-containing protein n=1 Tax=unclassified Nocardia TaxID=2637762 RepID=UPI003F97BAD4